MYHLQLKCLGLGAARASDCAFLSINLDNPTELSAQWPPTKTCIPLKMHELRLMDGEINPIVDNMKGTDE